MPLEKVTINIVESNAPEIRCTLAGENIPVELSNLRAELIPKLRERCGNEIAADGIQCPQCEALEVYKDASNPDDTDRWFWIIRAFKVDDWSDCTNCHYWFDMDGGLEPPEAE